MRWYRLSIGNYNKIYSHTYKRNEDGFLTVKSYDTKRYGATSSGGVTFESMKTFPRNYNPTPLNIEFEVNSYGGNGNSSTICGIRLHSQSISLFRNLQNQVTQKEKDGEGLDVTLEAGWDYENPLVKNKMGYTYINSGSMVIFKGQMAGISGDFNGKTSHINITAAYTRKHSADTKFRVQIKKGEVLIGPDKEGNVKLGDDGYYNCNTLLEVLQLLIRPDVKVAVTDDIVEIKNNKEDDLNWEIQNIQDFQYHIWDDFNLKLFIDNQTSMVILYQVNENLKDDDEIINDAYPKIREAKKKKLSQSNDLTDDQLTAISQAKEIKLSELLTQPTFLGFSTMLNVTTALRPDITLGSIIKLPTTIMNMGGSFSTGSQYIATTANQIDLTYSGQWIVTECRHRGNFYGKSGDSWCSQFVCIADANYKKEQEAAEKKKALANQVIETSKKQMARQLAAKGLWSGV